MYPDNFCKSYKVYAYTYECHVIQSTKQLRYFERLLFVELGESSFSGPRFRPEPNKVCNKTWVCVLDTSFLAQPNTSHISPLNTLAVLVMPSEWINKFLEFYIILQCIYLIWWKMMGYIGSPWCVHCMCCGMPKLGISQCLAGIYNLFWELWNTE